MPFPARGSYVKLGKGSLLLDIYDDSGNLQGYNFVGNANSVSLSAEVEDVELFSSTEASGPLIDRAVLRTSYTLTVSLNEFTMKNLELFLKGESASKAQAIVSQETVNFLSVVQGRYYDVGYRQITDVVVMQGTDTMVEGVDYSLNSEFGVVSVIVGGGIADGDDIAVTFAAPALTINQVRLSRKSSATAKLLYLADDANTQGTSAKDRLEVWKVDVAPDGELNLIGDDYGAFSLTMAILSDSENHPNDPFGTLDRVGASL